MVSATSELNVHCVHSPLREGTCGQWSRLGCICTAVTASSEGGTYGERSGLKYKCTAVTASSGEGAVVSVTSEVHVKCCESFLRCGEVQRWFLSHHMPLACGAVTSLHVYRRPDHSLHNTNLCRVGHVRLS